MAKKSMTQQAVSLVAPVMPAPVATVVTSRWGSRLFILLVPFLLATGVLTISWDNGMPTVNFDRARAWIVGKQVEEQAMRAVQEYESRTPGNAGQPQGWGQPQSSQWQPQASQSQPQAIQWQPQSSFASQQQVAPQPYQQQPPAQPPVQPYRPQQYGMQPYGSQQYGGQTQPYAPQPSYAPQAYPQPYVPQQMAQPYAAPAYR